MTAPLPAVVLALAVAAAAAGRQSPTLPAPPAQEAIVTVLPRKGAALPPIAASQVEVREGSSTATVTAWQPLSAADPRLDLVLALDDDSRDLGGRLDELRAFLAALPPNTAVGLVYLQNSTASIAAPFTLDHAGVARALRAPLGTPVASPSPFTSLDVLFHQWPRHPGRSRELILVSDGVDHLDINNGKDAPFQAALADAVRAGIVVYAIQIAGAALPPARSLTLIEQNGRAMTTPSATLAPDAIPADRSRADLNGLAESTGGEAFTSASSREILKPMLDDISVRLNSQYLLRYVPAPGAHPGFAELKISVPGCNCTVIAPRQAFVPNPTVP